jgi:hypothetical protein
MRMKRVCGGLLHRFVPARSSSSFSSGIPCTLSSTCCLNAATEFINDTELQGFVKKTLVITGGC